MLATVPESHRNLRHRLRSRSSWAGFGSLGPGCGSARTRRGPRRLARCSRSLGGSVHGTLLHARLDESRGATAPGRAGVGRGRPRSASTGPSWTASTPVQPDSPGRRWPTLAHLLYQWRRLLLADPGLPPSLLPAQWSGEQARRAPARPASSLAAYGPRVVARARGDGIGIDGWWTFGRFLTGVIEEPNFTGGAAGRFNEPRSCSQTGVDRRVDVWHHAAGREWRRRRATGHPLHRNARRRRDLDRRRRRPAGTARSCSTATASAHSPRPMPRIRPPRRRCSTAGMRWSDRPYDPNGSLWALASATRDQFASLAAVERAHRAPRLTLALGTSMGGLISAQEAQRAGGRLDGVVSTCGLRRRRHRPEQLPTRRRVRDHAGCSRPTRHPAGRLRAPGRRRGRRRPARPRVATAARATAAGSGAGRAGHRAAEHAHLVRVAGHAARPADSDGIAQAQYDWLVATLPFIMPARYFIELAVGGNASWNVGVNYGSCCARSPYRRRGDARSTARPASTSAPISPT